MAVNGKPAGRIVMELFADTTPRTAENFHTLCTGKKGIRTNGVSLHYKGSSIHGLAPKLILYGGDFTYGDGSGDEPIYSGFFEDENFIKMHNAPGIISMANRGPDTNSAQFMICMQECPGLRDYVHVAFSQVVEGLNVINKIMDEVETENGKPSKPVWIATVVIFHILEIFLSYNYNGSMFSAFLFFILI